MGKILYIAGIGHNGSTVLDIAFGFSEGVSSLSQLNDLPSFFRGGENTIPGDDYCRNFWADVVGALSPEEFKQLDALNDTVLREKAFPRMLVSATFRRRFAEVNEKVIDRVFELTGTPVIVDSTKNISRCLGLQELNNHEVYVLHLIRDQRGFIESVNKRKAEEDESASFFIPYARWLVKNIMASLFLRPRARRYMKLHYEEIKADPAGTVDRIAAFLDHPLEGTKRAMLSETPLQRPPSLTFAGNRVLTQKTFLFRKNSDDKAGASSFNYKRQVGITQEKLRSRWFWCTLGWVGRLWGYRRNGDLSSAK